MNKKIFLISLLTIVFVLFPFQGVNAQNCPASVAGNYTLSSSCIIPSGGNMSVVDGNLTINAGVTLTMDTNARLTITPGWGIYPNGTISMASGAYIVKKNHQVILNSASNNSCNTVCSDNGKGCVSIGQDSYGTYNYYWRSSACSFGSCEYISGNCSTVMSAQCSPANTCCGIATYWTRCLCVEN